MPYVEVYTGDRCQVIYPSLTPMRQIAQNGQQAVDGHAVRRDAAAGKACNEARQPAACAVGQAEPSETALREPRIECMHFICTTSHVVRVRPSKSSGQFSKARRQLRGACASRSHSARGADAHHFRSQGQPNVGRSPCSHVAIDTMYVFTYDTWHPRRTPWSHPSPPARRAPICID